MYCTQKQTPKTLFPQLEQELTTIWEAVLGVNPITKQDNFFELGGHSMLAIILVNEIEKKLGIPLSLTTLFENPNLGDLLIALQVLEQHTFPSTVIAIKPEGVKKPFFCVNGPRENFSRWFEEDQPYYWLSYIYQGSEAVEMSIEEMATIQIRNIKKIQPEGPYQIGGFSFGGIVAFEMAQQLLKAGEEVSLLALLDPSAPQIKQSHSDDKMKTRVIKLKRQQGLAGKFVLVSKKVCDWIYWRSKKSLRRLYQQIQIQYYKSRSMVLPPNLSLAHNLKLFRRLAGRYNFSAYPAKIILFVPECGEDTPHKIELLKKQWQAVAVNGIDIYAINKAFSHHQVIEEPYIKTLASYLNKYLM